MISNEMSSLYRYKVECDGEVVALFHEVSGLENSELEIEYRIKENDQPLRRLPGLTKYSNLVLKHGIVDANFNKWARSALEEGQTQVKQLFLSLLFEGGLSINTWRIEQAWVCKYDTSFGAMAGENMEVECIELVHEKIERVL